MCLRSLGANQKKEGEDSFAVFLNLLLAQSGPESLSTVFIEANGKFCPLAAFVWSASHLPGLLGTAYFLSTYRTFSHDNPF